MDDRRRWEDMELDCLVNIFRRLTLMDLTMGVPFACKLWRKASLDPLCWKILDFDGSQFAKRFEMQRAAKSLSFEGFMKLTVGRSCGLAVELRFPSTFEASIEDLLYVSNECPKLKILSIPNLAPEGDLRMSALAERWKDLEQLEMELKPPFFPELLAQIGVGCKNLVGLKACGPIAKGDASAIVGSTPGIKYLDLSRSYVRKEELLTIMEGCKEMERLNVSGCVGFQADEELLEMASSIKSFDHEGSKLTEHYTYDDSDWEQLYSSIAR